MTPPIRPSGAPRASRGFTLLELTISFGVLGLIMMAAVSTTAGATRIRSIGFDRGHGSVLGHDLMEEILQQHFVEPFEAPTFGPEWSETGGTRKTFDDIDDYDGWNASAPYLQPQTKDGTLLPDHDGWVRSVDITYVDPDDTSIVVGSDQGVKRIVVTVSRDDRVVSSFEMIMTAAWASR